MFVQELTANECRTALAKAGFGRLACARDNQPYVLPVYFAAEEDHVYSFSMPGQKIEWMRTNPRVCLEVDSVKDLNDWTTVVALGRFEELPDTPDRQAERHHAQELLQVRVMWWLPGSVGVGVVVAHEGPASTPVLYRIDIERMTGHRGMPAQEEMGAASPFLHGTNGG